MILPSLLSHALQRDESGFPPYNIEKIDDDAYAIVMALAGFVASTTASLPPLTMGALFRAHVVQFTLAASASSTGT